MRRFSSYMIAMFIIIFWILRIVITLAGQFGKSYLGLVPMNESFEIIILFVSIICFFVV